MSTRGTALKRAGPKRYRLTWRDIELRITHQRHAFGPDQSLIEIEVMAPKGARLPITDSGFRAEILLTSELVAAGGPHDYVLGWLEDEAAHQAVQGARAGSPQTLLFDNLPAQRKPSR